MNDCCKHTNTIIDAGCLTCTACGCVIRQHLDACERTWSEVENNSLRPLKVTYARVDRFKNLLATLCGLTEVGIDQALLEWMQSFVKNDSSPEKVVDAIKYFKFGTRAKRPYTHALQYHALMFPDVKRPTITWERVAFYCAWFDDLYFAWNRLGCKGPQFPYIFVLKQLAHHFGDKNMIYVLRFTKPLKCGVRRLRYQKYFDQCFKHATSDRIARSIFADL